jgi:NAD(P)H-hydrate epimerase
VHATLNTPDLWRRYLPRIGPESNKYTRGHVVVYGGYPMTGAARLAARSAARAGAGMVTIATTPSAVDSYLASMASIIVKPVDGADRFGDLVASDRVSAAVIGPGAGVGESTRNMVLAALGTGKPLVLDADALTSFAGQSAGLFSATFGPCVMTPHEGEFERLFTLAGTREERTTAAAKTSGSVVVLKGARTVVAAPTGETVVNDDAPATLATAGSGDVLAGVIGAFLAGGMPAFEASCAAVWLHGRAATLGPPGLIADDLPELVAVALARL